MRLRGRLRLPGLLAALLLAALLFAAPLPVAGAPAGRAETWYLSNRLGMKLESIPRYRADEFRYVMRETVEAGGTILSLYEGGGQGSGSTPSSALEGPPRGSVELSRWERSPAPGGGTVLRVFERGELLRVDTYRADGKLASEDTYAAGTLAERQTYLYAGGVVKAVEGHSPAGELKWTVAYRVGPSGLLRSTVRTGTEPEAAAFQFGGYRLVEEDLKSPNHTLVLRYDAQGHRVVWEVYAGERLALATYSDYDAATGGLAREVERAADERTERGYDEKGRVAVEQVYRGERLFATVRYAYDEQGRTTSMERRSEAGIELESYGYAADGSLAWKERRDRGALRSRIVYTGENTRYEEVLQSDRSSLRVYYKAEERVREEVLRDGKVIRSRLYGEPQ